ncbi:hypothetical protein FOZ63_019884, partial [Perkinsus olseni]
PTKTIVYEDDVKVRVFQHKAKLFESYLPSLELTFGLMINQDPPPTDSSPTSSLGLAPDQGDENSPSLVKQLRSRGVIGSTTFALYLSLCGQSSFSGGLILGGGDPSLYKHPLQFVKFTESSLGEYFVTKINEVFVNLGTLQVGGAHITIGINEDLLLDTGTNFLYVSQLYYDAIIRDIQAQANKAAGTTVDIKFDSSRNVWTFSCRYMPTLPPLVFGLGTKGAVPLKLSYLSYARNDQGSCYLIIKKQDDDDSWTLPGSSIIGNYFEFQPDLGRVGIAQVSSR